MRSNCLRSRAHTVVWAAVLGGLGGTACASARPATEGGARPSGVASRADSGRTAASMESVNSLEEASFGQLPVNRVEELFIGRFPGVQVYNVNGQVQIRIRGASSISANTEPLILIDGQQMTPGSGGLIGINPRDIAKIQVLKDAVSTAEFGVRGSNGVIKITTRRP